MADDNTNQLSGGSVLDALSASIAVIDTSGEIVYVNSEWKRFARDNGNADAAGGVGDNYVDACLRASDVDVAAGIRGVVEHRLPSYVHVYPCHSPSRERWFRMVVTPLREPGSAGAAVIAHFDVTSLKLAERALRDREALLANAQRVGGLGLWHYDGLKKHLTWSDETCRIFGVEPGSFAATFEAFFSFVHPDDRKRLLPIMEHPVDGHPIELEYRIIRADGEERVILERGEVVYDDAGVLLRKLGVVMDVTERHRADGALRESEDRYRDLVENSSDLICTHDLEGRLLSVNPSASAFSGYPVEALLQMNMAELAAPDVRSKFADYLADVRRNGRASGILKVQTARGEIRYWEYENTLRADNVATPVVRGRARDITDRVHVERQLRRHMQRLTAIIETQRSLASTEASIDELHGTLAGLARQVLSAEGGVFAILEGDRLVYRSVSGDAAYVGFSVPLVGSLAGDSFRQNRTLRCDDAETDPRVHAALCREVRLRSMVVTPVRVADAPIGVIKVFSPSPNRFTAADESTLALVAESIGAVIERKRAEAALRESESRLLESQRIAQLGNWEWNLATLEIWWSEEVYRMFGTSQAALGRRPTIDDILGVVHRDDRPQVTAAIERSIQTREPYDLEMRISGFDGVERVLHARGKVFYDSDDRPQRMVGNIQDITARKEAERRLERSDTLVQIASRVAHLGGWLYDVSAADRVFWSDEVADIHEVPRGTHPPVGEAINFYPPEWRARISEVFRLCIAEGVPFDEELEIVTATGRRVWVRSVGEAVRNASGAVAFVQGAFQDISEKKRAEAEILAVENRLATTLESISDGFMTLDREWRITFVNSEFERLTRRERSHMLGRNMWEEFPEAAGTVFETEYRRAIAEQRSVRFEQFYSGTGMWMEVHAHPTEEGLAVYLRDVTERHQAEERLRQQEEQYRAIVEAVNDAILILDSEERVITANHAACVMHGYRYDELIGRQLSDLVHPADLRRVQQIVTNARQGDPSYTEAVHVKRDRGEVQVVANSASFLLSGVPHVLLVVSNVSEQKRLQQQLERTARISSLGRLAANIAHEMNNVMMGILPFTEIIKRKTTGDTMLQTAASHIAKSVERGKVVTQEILRFTRAASDPELKPVDCCRLIEDVADELRSAIPPSMTLELSCEPGLYALCDAGQLQQVVTNLVMNARDAMPAGGRISLGMFTSSERTIASFAGVEVPGQYVQLEVRDEGVGIAPAVIGQIFEPLFTTKGAAGTGLGLAIVHQIVALHGGQVSVESTPGAGTTFRVVLRKADARRVPEVVAPSSTATWRDVRHVVLVEDEPLVAEGIAALLGAEGVTCEHIELGRSAIDRLLVFRPDLLILDVGLADMSGIDVYRAIKEAQPDLPTIFSTGHGDHRLLADLGAPAHVGFISKPYSFEDLSRQVARLRRRS